MNEFVRRLVPMSMRYVTITIALLGLISLGFGNSGCKQEGTLDWEFVLPADKDREPDLTTDLDPTDPPEPDLQETAEPETSIQTIPDGSGFLELVRTVTDTFVVDIVHVRITIEHPAVEELGIELESPLGTVAWLHHPGGAHQADLNIDVRLHHFAGEDALGDWILRIHDYLPGNAGVVKDWAIEFEVEPDGDTADFEEAEWERIPDGQDDGVEFRFEVLDEFEVGVVVLHLEFDHPFLGDIRIKVVAPNGESAIVWQETRRQDTNIPNPLYCFQFAGLESRGVWLVKVSDVVEGDAGYVRFLGAEVLPSGADLDFDLPAETEPDEADDSLEGEAGTPIPDGTLAGVEFTYEQTQPGVVLAAGAFVFFDHPRPADLVVFMYSPQTERVRLIPERPIDGGIFFSTDEFNGTDAQGLWRLVVADIRHGETGRVFNVEFAIEVAIPSDGDEEVSTETEIEPEILEETTEPEPELEPEPEPDDGRLWIPDNDPNGLEIELEHSGEVGVVCLSLEIVHTFPGDLAAKLVSPSDQEVGLFEPDPNRPYPNLQFATELYQFVGSDGTGTWKLIITDTFEGDVGYVESYSIDFNCPVPTDGDQEYEPEIEQQPEQELEELEVEVEPELEAEAEAEPEPEVEPELEPEPEPEPEPELEPEPPLVGGTCAEPLNLELPSFSVVQFPTEPQDLLEPPVSCAGWNLDGKEVVLSFEVSDIKRPVVFSVTSETDYGLYVLTDCNDANTCIVGSDAAAAGEPESLKFSPPQPGIYYLVVDTVEGSELAPFELLAATCIKEKFEATEPVAVPDLSSATSEIRVPYNFDIDKLSVGVDISADYLSDLTIKLLTPWGEAYTLRNRRSGTSHYVEEFNLWKLHGYPAGGTWKLEVIDNASPGESTINSWYLRFYCDPEVEGCDPEAEPAQCSDDDWHNLNNVPCRAVELEAPAVVEGVVCRGRLIRETYEDWFSFWLYPRETATLTLSTDEGNDVDLYLYDDPSNLFSPLASETGSEPTKTITYRTYTLKYLWVRVRDFKRETEFPYTLTLEVEHPEPDGDEEEEVELPPITDCDPNAEPAPCDPDEYQNQNNVPCRAVYAELPFDLTGGYVCRTGWSNDEIFPDWFAFWLDEGQTVYILVEFEDYDIDVYLYKYSEGDLSWVTSSSSTSRPEELEYTAEESGFYWLKLKPFTTDVQIQYDLHIELR